MAKMGEKRRHPRIRRKLKVVLTHDPTRRAYTTDIAPSGIAIASDYVTTPGSEVRGEIELPDGRAVFRACVRWARKARGRAILVGTNAMGLEFVTPPGPSYQQFIESIVGQAPPAVQAPRPSPRQPTTHAIGSQTPAREPSLTPLASEGERGQPPAANRGSTSVGRTAQHSVVVGSSDIVPAQENPAGVALVRLISWMEEASQRCIGPFLPQGSDSTVVGSSITVSHVAPVQAGASVTTTATITQVSEDGRVYRFELQINAGARLLAKGVIARTLQRQ